MKLLGKVGRAIRNPWRILEQIWDRISPPPFLEGLKWDKLERMSYAYGLYHAALQAKALGIPAISAVEFGVAGGNGLVALERYAEEVERETSVRCHVFGFDMGDGMPAPVDYRDMPYIWQPGFFRMDVELLKLRLKRAELILGDVAKTIPEFASRSELPPLGFVSFDLDFYWSTMEALRLFEQAPDRLLPRVFCYFDDCIGDDWELHSPFAGELLAINDFNQKHPSRKLAQIYGLRHKRKRPAMWNDMMFVMHGFDHPRYNDHLEAKRDWQLPLSMPDAKQGSRRA
jgi:hypothetical protein